MSLPNKKARYNVHRAVSRVSKQFPNYCPGILRECEASKLRQYNTVLEEQAIPDGIRSKICTVLYRVWAYFSGRFVFF
jgi:hypothetical protein